MTELDEIEREIRALHRGWINANKIGDTAWLRTHVAPGDALVFFNHNGSNYAGVEAAVQLWEHLRNAALSSPHPPRKVVLEDRDVQVIPGRETSVVSYLAWFEADFGAAGTESTGSRGTEVWARLNDAWKLVHLHCSVHTPGVNLGH